MRYAYSSSIRSRCWNSCVHKTLYARALSMQCKPLRRPRTRPTTTPNTHRCLLVQHFPRNETPNEPNSRFYTISCVAQRWQPCFLARTRPYRPKVWRTQLTAKIDDTVFHVHSGLRPVLNRMPLCCFRLGKIARHYLACRLLSLGRVQAPAVYQSWQC